MAISILFLFFANLHLGTSYFKGEENEFDFREKDWFLHIKGDDSDWKDEISHVPNFQRDNSYCMRYLKEALHEINEGGETSCLKYDSFLSKHNIYNSRWEQADWWAQIFFDQPMRVEYLKLLFERHDPTRDSFISHLKIKHRLHVKDRFISHFDGNEEKIYQVMKEEGREEFLGYGSVHIEPSITAIQIRIYEYLGWVKDKMLIFHAYGCHDDYTLQDLQIANEKEDIPPYVTNTFHSDRNWMLSLKPDFESGCSIFDFEQNKLVNWTVEGNAFENQPLSGDFKFQCERKMATGIKGQGWIASFDQESCSTQLNTFSGNEKTGTILSTKFFINASEYSFLIGGGDYSKRIGMELIVFGKKVAEYYLNEQLPTMKRVVLKVKDSMNRPAQIKLVDRSSSGYLMFDDFRSVGRCNDFCSRPLGMQSGDISQSSITTSIDEKNQAEERRAINSRLANTRSDEKYFKFSINKVLSTLFKSAKVDGFYSEWLQVRLTVASVVDGWATQDFQSKDRKTKCSISFYHVMYALEHPAFRYISRRELKNGKQVPRRIRFEHIEHELTRYWLNPRVSAKYVRFVFPSDQNKLHDYYCLRVEIYGCPKYTINENGQPIANEDYLAGYEQGISSSSSYQLEVINVGSEILGRRYINLTCYTSPTMPEVFIATEYIWLETVYNSVFSLKRTGVYTLLPIHFRFYKRNIQCKMMNENKDVLFTKDFLLLEKNTEMIMPFVTATPFTDYNGGRLIYSDPAEHFVEGYNLLYFKIHLANLVYPMVRVIPNYKYCPRKYAFHDTYVGYKKYIASNQVDCFEQAMRDGAKSISFTDFVNYCYAGPAVNTWYAHREAEGCERINSIYDREFGIKCRKSCAIMQKIDLMMPTGDLYKVHPHTQLYYLELKIFLDEELLYDQSFYCFPGFGENKYRSFIVPSLFFHDEGRTMKKQEPKNEQNQNNMGILYHNCQKNTKDDITNPMCSSHFSFYGSVPFKTGFFPTFTFALRKSSFYGKRNIKIESTYLWRKQKVKKRFSHYINIRSKSEPKIALPGKIGICHHHLKEIITDVSTESAFWTGFHLFKYKWSKVTPETYTSEERVETVPYNVNKDVSYYQSGKSLIFLNASVEHNGLYEFLVDSPLGSMHRKTEVVVTKDYSKITSSTPSPHIVVEGKSDIVEIKVNHNNDIEEIKWYKDNVIIKSPHNNYAFIDYNGEEYQKKRLLIKNVQGAPLDGLYRVELIGKYCSFMRSIQIEVHEKPLIMFETKKQQKHAIFNMNSEGSITAKIHGGKPALSIESMKWFKNEKELASMKEGRLSFDYQLSDDNSWVSILTIRNVEYTDEGLYMFTATAGKARSESSIKLFVENPLLKKKRVESNSSQVNEDVTKKSNALSLYQFNITYLMFSIFVFYASLFNL